MKIIQYVIYFLVSLNIGFASPASAEAQGCPMNHEMMQQEHVKEMPTSTHDCCDELQLPLISHDCDGDCAQCQTHCHITFVILPVNLQLDGMPHLQDQHLYTLFHYPKPQQSWLIPPIT